MIALQKFSNLMQLFSYFKDEQTCREYLATIRWDGEPVCPYKECGHDKVFKFSNGKVYKGVSKIDFNDALKTAVK